ncbi:MAG: hypothetical protein KME22_03900 [Hassallia sp. WJT32-NPBG1]|jgi:hypothetical protein|nr:hypothetical protein [Spirirestis rafaelensis WJT71-NPBG6]MBW4606375.1 hypothetical protein [Hassallia sp. WJT32-NPBG1]
MFQKYRVKMVEKTVGINDLGRRENPEYSRVTGLVNRELAKRLRVFVATTETTISEVVEKALQKYIDEFEAEANSTENANSQAKAEGKGVA